MDLEGKSFRLESFSTANAVVKTKLDASELANLFHETLNSQLEKKGLAIDKGGGGAQIVIRGQVVKIDEGNRWLRYFLTFLGGKTVFEVEGQVLINGLVAGELHSAKKSGAGLFGGSPSNLLRNNARSAARDITGQVMKAIKESHT
jgi:hypothetical protein